MVGLGLECRQFLESWAFGEDWGRQCVPALQDKVWEGAADELWTGGWQRSCELERVATEGLALPARPGCSVNSCWGRYHVGKQSWTWYALQLIQVAQPVNMPSDCQAGEQ